MSTSFDDQAEPDAARSQSRSRSRRQQGTKITCDLDCKRAQPVGHQLDIAVAGVRGLALRVTPAGVKVWTYRYRRHSDNALRRMNFGSYPQTSLADARGKAQEARTAVDAGRDPADAKAERQAGYDVAGLGQLWLAKKRSQGRAASYIAAGERRIEALPKWFKQLKIADVERAHIKKVRNEAAARGQAESNAVLRVLSAMFGFAFDEELIRHDPSDGVKPDFDEQPRERFFNDDEIKLFWHGIDKLPASEPAKLAIKLCLVLGQRPIEITSMKKSAVELDGAVPTLIIPREISKNKTEHVLPLPRLAVELLREAMKLAGRSKWVFPSPSGDGPIDRHSLSTIIMRARDDEGRLFGIPDAQLYDARKTLATWLGNQGHPNELIAVLLNHLSSKRGSVTGRSYNHATYLAQKKALLDQWAAHLESLVGIARESNVVPMSVAMTAKRGA